MNLQRSYSRNTSQMRPLSMKIDFYDYAEGSCLVQYGNTHVLCVATIQENVPPHIRESDTGWITAEYNMLPRSSPERIQRERSKLGGRTQEIQRLIGRSLRSVTTMKGWGNRSILIDCDVLRADGGTRTASISGAFVAMAMAFRHLKKSGKLSPNLKFPLTDYLAAVSVGVVKSVPVLDLDYSEDSKADSDVNFVMTSKMEFVEVQGTAEQSPFSRTAFSNLIDLAETGCRHIFEVQKSILGNLDWQ